jgi:DNA-binding NarL/FixJ family response regulator
MFYIIFTMTNPLQRLLAFLRLEPFLPPRDYELDEPLQVALAERAGLEQRLPADVRADLLAAGLANLQISEGLRPCWEKLSVREQQVTALTCLGYTNRQMASLLGLSPVTVKGYVHQALIKWKVHGKSELRLLLYQWDFSGWDVPVP